MTLADLQCCLADREAEGIEFKRSLLSRKEIAAYAVGIGNAGGGHLLMGVTNQPPRQIQAVAPLSADDIQQIRRSVYDSAQIHISVENPKGRVLNALNKGPLSNAQLREITQLSRQQVTRLMNELRAEPGVLLRGKKQGQPLDFARHA